MGSCYLAPDRVKLTVNRKKKQTSGSKWAKSQNGPRVKIGFCFLPPDRVKLSVNSKGKQTTGSKRANSGDLRQRSSNNSVTNFVPGFPYIFQRETQPSFEDLLLVVLVIP